MLIFYADSLSNTPKLTREHWKAENEKSKKLLNNYRTGTPVEFQHAKMHFNVNFYSTFFPSNREKKHNRIYLNLSFRWKHQKNSQLKLYDEMQKIQMLNKLSIVKLGWFLCSRSTKWSIPDYQHTHTIYRF